MDLILSLRAASGGLEPLWLLVTNLGSENAFIVLLALYFWLVDPHSGRRLGMAVGLSFFLNSALKNSLNMPRPFFSDASLASAQAQATAAGGGFPSGHAQSTALYWTAVAFFQGRRWLWVVAAVITVLVSFSRLALGVHFLVDVLGGLAIGLALAAVVIGAPSPQMWPLAIRAGALMFTFAVASVYPESDYGRSLGVASGFFLSTPRLGPPATWGGRVLVGVVGLVLVFGLYFALSAGMGSAGRTGAGSSLRYLILTLFATEAVPRLFGRVMERGEATPVSMGPEARA